MYRYRQGVPVRCITRGTLHGACTGTPVCDTPGQFTYGTYISRLQRTEYVESLCSVPSIQLVSSEAEVRIVSHETSWKSMSLQGLSTARQSLEHSTPVLSVLCKPPSPSPLPCCGCCLAAPRKVTKNLPTSLTLARLGRSGALLVPSRVALLSGFPVFGSSSSLHLRRPFSSLPPYPFTP